MCKEEKSLPYSNKCRRSNEIENSPYGTSHSNNYFRWEITGESLMRKRILHGLQIRYVSTKGKLIVEKPSRYYLTKSWTLALPTIK